MPLKFDWITPMLRLNTLPHSEAQPMMEVAEWFVERVAVFAEQAGWQPAHFYKPPNGLLYRWKALDQLGTKLSLPKRGYLGIEIGQHYFLYKAHRDGDVTIATGDERKHVLGVA